MTQTAALFGPHLLGLLTLVAGAPARRSRTWRALAAAAAPRRRRLGLRRLAARPAGAGPRETPLLVRLVQPNARQELKWQPGMEQLFYERHLALTAAEPRPDVTIWSETAVPFVLGHAPDLLAQSAAAAAPGRLVLGIRRVEPAPDGDRWFNSLAVLDPDGTAAAVYDKHHLVPFGEYIPLQGAVARLGLPALTTLTRGGFTPGDGPHLVAVPGLPALPAAHLLRGDLPRRAPRAGGAPRVAGAGDQRRLVRRGLGALAALRPGADAGDRAGPAAGARRQYRRLGDGRSATAGWSRSLGLGEAGAVDALLPGPLPPTFYSRYGDLRALTAIVGLIGINCFNVLQWNFPKVAPIAGPGVTRGRACGSIGRQGAATSAPRDDRRRVCVVR